MAFTYEPHSPEFPDVLVIDSPVHHDMRGCFREMFSKDDEFMRTHFGFLQLNRSMSKQDVIRGLHYQAGDAAQAKYIMCTDGVIYDVFVDLRRSSPAFGTWGSAQLGGPGSNMLYIPKGFAHGFLCMSKEGCIVDYLVDAPRVAAAERHISFDDPALNIHWPLPPNQKPVLSTKDLEKHSFSVADWFE